MKVVIFSDWEPDDVLAIAVIVNKFNGAKITLVITENNTGVQIEKCFDAKHLFPGVEVFTGATSNKPYAFVQNTNARVVRINPYLVNDVLPDKPDVVFCLAPPRDMISISMRDRWFFQNTDAFFYGGFNFATLNIHNSFFNFNEWLCSGFRMAVVFETNFAYPNQKNFTRSSGPLINFLEEKASENPLFKRLHHLSYNWDKHIRDDCRETFEKIAARYGTLFPRPIDTENRADEYIERAKEGNMNHGDMLSVINNLTVFKATKDLDYQLVAADPLVAAMFEDFYPESVLFRRVEFIAGESYRYVDCAQSNLFLFDPEDKQKAHVEVELKIVNNLLN